jgi:hypothetical protein
VSADLLVVVAFGAQALAFTLVLAALWKLWRGPLSQSLGNVRPLAVQAKGLGESAKRLTALAPRVKSIANRARSVRAAASLAPPPAGMVLTPQNLLKGVGMARTAKTLLKSRKLPRKKPSLAFTTAKRLGLIPPAAIPLLRAASVARTALALARRTRK